MRLLRILMVMSVIALVAVPAFAITINEVRIDQVSTDNDEYIEFIGQPGEPFTDMWLLTVGDGSAASGVPDGIVDLSAQVINANGFFVVGEGTMTIAVPDLVATLGFENSDNVTHMLVTNLNPAISTTSDLDVDDDGVMEPTGDYDGDLIDDGAPFTAIVDCVALFENAAGEQIYCATVVGPDGTFVPGHSYVCSDTGAWAIGIFDILVGVDTPGTANPNCAVAVEPTTWGTLKSLY